MQTKQWKKVRKETWNKLNYKYNLYKAENSILKHELIKAKNENKVLKSHNKLYAEFNSLQFEKRITSLIKALRVTAEALSKSVRRYD